MRILYHHRTLGDGAEGIHIREIVTAFRDLGHTVEIFSPIGDQLPRFAGEPAGEAPRGRRLGKIKAMMPQVIFEIAEIAYNLYAFFVLRKRIRRFRPDFIYDRYATYNASSILAGHRAGVPVVLEVNAPLAYERKHEPDEILCFPRLAERFERWICSRADLTLVVSTPLRDHLIEHGVEPRRLVVMVNGADPERFSPDHSGAAIRLRYGLGKRIVVGFSGVLRRWHGLDALLAALAPIDPQEIDWHLLIVGDGPCRAELEGQIGQAALGDRVTITGRVPHEDIPEYVAAFDIAVSPRATFYASPMKILEYMAMGRAIIAPDGENIRDILIDGEEALLVPPGDREALRAAIERLARDEALRARFASRVRAKVVSTLNWRRNAEEVLTLMSRIARQKEHVG